jgi:hypothetical protein
VVQGVEAAGLPLVLLHAWPPDLLLLPPLLPCLIHAAVRPARQ